MAEGESVYIHHSGESEIERVVSVAHGREWVGVGSKERPEDGGITVAGGHHQSRFAVRTRFVYIGPCLQERRHGAELVLVDGVHQSGPTIDASMEVRIGASTNGC